jgi:hypothetical protein
MKYVKSFDLFESKIPSHDEIIKMLKKNFVNYTNPGATFPVNVLDEKTGKTIKVMDFYFDENGELEIKEEIKESKITKGLAALCLIGGMLTSCKKDQLYDIGKDARYILKPSILNTLGREHFDSPVSNKSKTYVWAGNQNGSQEPTRYNYLDFTNKTKSYGTVYGQNYPDSAQDGVLSVISPTEVIQVIDLDNNILSKLEPYNKTGKSLDQLIKKYKYAVVVEVLGSTRYTWKDINKPEEAGSSRKTGYGIYLTNLPDINVGELYPSTLDLMFNTYKTSTTGNDKLIALDDYYNFNFKNLLDEKPVL